MINTHELFSVRIIEYQLSNEELDSVKFDFKDAIDNLDKNKNKNIPEVTSDYGNSNYKFSQNLLNLLSKFLLSYGKSLHPFYQGNINSYWLQNYKKGDHHGWHIHQNSIVSGVLYIDCENAQEIRFKNPDPTAAFLNLENEHKSFVPYSGSLILFPSWISHEVPVVELENSKRLILAFNSV